MYDTVFDMKRDIVQAVTIPILIDADTKEATDRKTFWPISETEAETKESLFVREFTKQDADEWIRSCSPKDFAIFLGLSHIKLGFDTEDEYTLMLGYEKLRPFVKGLILPEDRKIELAKSRISIGGGTGYKWWATIFNYSGLLTKMLEKTRLVMWYSLETYNKFLPAIHCPDKKTAVFAMRLVGPLRVCPKCDAPFVPAASNVVFCCIQHREAYRVDRFRWNEKRAETRSTKPKKPAAKRKPAKRV